MQSANNLSQLLEELQQAQAQAPQAGGGAVPPGGAAAPRAGSQRVVPEARQELHSPCFNIFNDNQKANLANLIKEGSGSEVRFKEAVDEALDEVQQELEHPSIPLTSEDERKRFKFLQNEFFPTLCNASPAVDYFLDENYRELAQKYNPDTFDQNKNKLTQKLLALLKNPSFRTQLTMELANNRRRLKDEQEQENKKDHGQHFRMKVGSTMSAMQGQGLYDPLIRTGMLLAELIEYIGSYINDANFPDGMPLFASDKDSSLEQVRQFSRRAHGMEGFPA